MSHKRIRFSKDEAQNVDGSVITVRVGKGAKSQDFHVHENVLRRNSPFFANALKKEWLEAETRVVELPESEPRVFDIYVQWIYSGRIVSRDPDDDKTDRNHGSTNVCQELSRFDKTSILGDVLQDDDFRDACLDARMERVKIRGACDLRLAAHYYKHSTAKSSYKEFALEYLVREVDEFDLKHCLEDPRANTAFHIAVALRLKAALHNKCIKFAYWKDPCKYHLHTDSGKPCYRKKWGLE